MAIKNIVGRSFLYGILVFQVCNAVDVKIQVCAIDGSKIEQVGVDQPFIVQVTTSGATGNEQPRIYESDNVTLVNSGHQIKIINGISDSVYKYRATAQREGECTIGPAVIEDGFTQHQSSSINLKVGAEQKTSADSKKKKSHPEPKLTISLDKERVYKGQRTRIFVRFYRVNGVQLEGIAPPSLAERDDLKMNVVSGPYHGSEKIDHTVHKYVEWQWELYPNVDGLITIPAFSADFLVQMDRMNTFGTLSSFFSLGQERKRLYSNSIKLQVVPLPEHTGPVHAVGVFNSYSAQLDPVVAKVGDGLVITRELVGQAQVKDIVLPEWENMPESFRCYESKTTCTMAPSLKDMHVKRVEYVLQGLESGFFEIPSQKFTYFDTNQERYITLETRPLTLSLRGRALSVPVQSVSEPESDVSPSLCIDSHVYPIYSNGWWPSYQQGLSPFSFYMLLIIFGVLWIFLCVRHSLRRIVEAHCNKKASLYACKKARAELALAQQKKDYAVIHRIMMKMIAARLGIGLDALTDDLIEKNLVKKGLSGALIALWHTFYSQSAEMVFTGRRLVDIEKEDLFNQARQWIDRLDGLL